MADAPWVRGKLLGSGSFGQVNLALGTATGELFAVKSVPVPRECEGQGCTELEGLRGDQRAQCGSLRALEHEIRVLSQLDCAQIVQFRGASWTEEDTWHGAAGEVYDGCRPKQLWRNLHVELAPGGSVAGLLKDRGRTGLDTALLQRYTRDLTRALDYLHSRGIVHGDVKGLNLLIMGPGAKLADFGTAWRAPDSPPTEPEPLPTAGQADAETSALLGTQSHGEKSAGRLDSAWELQAEPAEQPQGAGLGTSVDAETNASSVPAVDATLSSDAGRSAPGACLLSAMVLPGSQSTNAAGSEAISFQKPQPLSIPTTAGAPSLSPSPGPGWQKPVSPSCAQASAVSSNHTQELQHSHGAGRSASAGSSVAGLACSIRGDAGRLGAGCEPEAVAMAVDEDPAEGRALDAEGGEGLEEVATMRHGKKAKHRRGEDAGNPGTGGGSGASVVRKEKRRRELKGSPFWMSPETVRERCAQGTPVDIWSLGCTVLEMATGRAPWSELKGGLCAVLYAIACTDALPHVPELLPPVVQDFIWRCLKRDPRERPTASELLKHPFLSSKIQDLASWQHPGVAGLAAQQQQQSAVSGALPGTWTSGARSRIEGVSAASPWRQDEVAEHGKARPELEQGQMESLQQQGSLQPMASPLSAMLDCLSQSRGGGGCSSVPSAPLAGPNLPKPGAAPAAPWAIPSLSPLGPAGARPGTRKRGLSPLGCMVLEKASQHAGISTARSQSQYQSPCRKREREGEHGEAGADPHPPAHHPFSQEHQDQRHGGQGDGPLQLRQDGPKESGPETESLMMSFPLLDLSMLKDKVKPPDSQPGEGASFPLRATASSAAQTGGTSTGATSLMWPSSPLAQLGSGWIVVRSPSTDGVSFQQP